MCKIINEKRLRALAIKIGINDGHGWKSALQKKLLQKKPSIISTWIGRGVPKEFENILAMASIDVKIWREIIENVNNSIKTGEGSLICQININRHVLKYLAWEAVHRIKHFYTGQYLST